MVRFFNEYNTKQEARPYKLSERVCLGSFAFAFVCGSWVGCHVRCQDLLSVEQSFWSSRARTSSVIIHLAWLCKMTSACNKYAFSTLSEVVIQPTFKLYVIESVTFKKSVWIIKFQTNGTFSLAWRITPCTSSLPS
jgi:hypothetical protein